jgi:hypothetical protein
VKAHKTHKKFGLEAYFKINKTFLLPDMPTHFCCFPVQQDYRFGIKLFPLNAF